MRAKYFGSPTEHARAIAEWGSPTEIAHYPPHLRCQHCAYCAPIRPNTRADTKIPCHFLNLRTYRNALCKHFEAKENHVPAPQNHQASDE